MAHLLRIGTLSHALRHLLGVRDLYNIGTSASGVDNGICNYDLMAYGNFGFNNTDYYPTSLSAYHKNFTGWVSHEEIIAAGWFTLWSGIHQVYKIAHGFPSSKYLLPKNQQPVEHNSTITDGGIAIYHVNKQIKKQTFCG